MKKLAVLIWTILLVLGVVGQAHATLLNGNALTFEWLYPDTSSSLVGPDVYTVGPGVEIKDVFGSTPTSIDISIDISDTNILIVWYGIFPPPPGFNGFNGPHFFDASDLIDPFTSVSINPATNVADFDISRISFDEDNIFINLQGLTSITSEKVLVSLDLQSVPEPTTLLLLGTGLVVLAGLSRRKFFK